MYAPSMPSCEEEYYSSILLFVTKCLEEWRLQMGIDTRITEAVHMSSINAYPDKDSCDTRAGKEELLSE